MKRQKSSRPARARPGTEFGPSRSKRGSMGQSDALP
jgi:hypothetical protein